MAAADVSHVRVGEIPDEKTQGIGCPARVRVGERDDLAGRLAHCAILCGDFPGALAFEQANLRIGFCNRTDDGVRFVGRRVRRDHDLEAIAGIVLREEILDAGSDDGFLVVRGDDDAH